MPKRLAAVVLSLFIATLACARAEVPITPATPQLQIVELIDTPAAPTEAPVVATPEPSATTSGYPVATDAPPSPTSVIQLPPTETPTITDTPPATDTPPPTSTRAPATTTSRAAATATRVTGASATATSAPATGGGPQPIPANATFTQVLAIDYSGGTLFGETLNLIDKRTETWASIRESDGVFVLDLGAPQNVAGVRVYPKKDGNDPARSVVTLLRLEVSADGNTWTTVLNGTGNCGVPRCDTLTPGQYVDLGFATTRAQYVRLVGGPTRLAFAEVQVAVLP
ncbi:MAG: discoidin domain-containing protein [Anaerolineales bacterium]